MTNLIRLYLLFWSVCLFVVVVGGFLFCFCLFVCLFVVVFFFGGGGGGGGGVLG